MQQTPASAHWYESSLAVLQRAATLAARERESLRDWEARRGRRVVNHAVANVYDELGQTWLRLGNPAAAIEAFEQSLHANPAQPAVADHLRFAREMQR
jgi:tetratricopeptide (TPR) repeat protein